MTDIAALVDAAPMPPGYELQVWPQREYKYRSMWAVRVLKDGEPVFGRAAYNPAAAIAAAQRWAWEQTRSAA